MFTSIALLGFLVDEGEVFCSARTGTQRRTFLDLVFSPCNNISTSSLCSVASSKHLECQP